MTTDLKRRLLLHTGWAAGALLTGRVAQACEFFSPTLRITHPWTRATPLHAAFAVVGMRFDEVTEDEQLLAVETPVAQAAVLAPMDAPMQAPMDAAAHGSATGALPLHLPAGSDTVLGSGAPASQQLHLLRLTQDLQVARSYPMWLTFKKGGTVKVMLSVDYARFG